MQNNLENWQERMAADHHIKELGIFIKETKPGYAKVSLKIQEKHLNGLGVTNGGVIFSLADYAFAVAGNAGRKPSVAATVTVSFLQSSKTGDTLTAVCNVDKQGKKIGFYNINVYNQENKLIATAKGTSCTLQ